MKIFSKPIKQDDNILRSNAPKIAGKTKFFPMYQVALFIFISVFLFIILFPGPEISRYFNRHFEIKPITIRYLNALLKDYSGIGKSLPITDKVITPEEYQTIYNSMLSNLNQVPVTDQDWRMHWIAYQIFRWTVFAQQPGTPFRNIAQQKLASVIPIFLNDPFIHEHFKALASDSLFINNQKMALVFYQKGLTNNPNVTLDELVKAAEIAKWASNYEVAAAYYFNASQKVQQIKLKRMYFIEGINSLLAGSLYQKAIENIDQHLGELQNDPETLIFLSKTALSANRPDLANQYISRVINMRRKQ